MLCNIRSGVDSRFDTFAPPCESFMTGCVSPSEREAQSKCRAAGVLPYVSNLSHALITCYERYFWEWARGSLKDESLPYSKACRGNVGGKRDST